MATGPARTEQQDPPTGTERRTARAVVVLSLAVTLVVLGLVGWWYALDEGWIAVGGGWSQLLDPGPARSAVAVAVLAMAGAATATVLAWTSDDRRRTWLATAAGVLAAALAPLAVAAYPAPTPDVLVGLDPDTGAPAWTTTTPADRLLGVRSTDGDTAVVAGRIDERGCRSTPIDLRVDLRTGAVLEVVELPDTFPSIEDAPPPPGQPEVAGLRIEPGQWTVTCAD